MSVKDINVGNVRVTFRDIKMPTGSGSQPFRADLLSKSEYYPYGMKINDLSYNATGARYGYNGTNEMDNEVKGNVGNHLSFGDFGYDTRVARRFNLDPKAHLSLGWTAYRGFINNPVRFIDPDGLWEADANGDLIAEKNDNAQTLTNFQGIKYSDALQQLKDQGFTVNSKGILNLNVGDKLELKNVFTQSIDNTPSDLTLDNTLNCEGITYTTTLNPKTGEVEGEPEDEYNCWGAAIAGSQGNEIKVGVGIPKGSTFDALLLKDYSPTNSENAIFGKTVLRFEKDGITTHGAVYYGKNNAGEIYVYTKNGWDLKPEVMKLSRLLKGIPSYGPVQGIDPSHSGYYDPNR